jgi:hypothetical protein
MRWTGHVTFVEERRNAYRVLVWNLREGDHLKDQGVDGRVILSESSSSGMEYIHY